VILCCRSAQINAACTWPADAAIFAKPLFSSTACCQFLYPANLNCCSEVDCEKYLQQKQNAAFCFTENSKQSFPWYHEVWKSRKHLPYCFGANVSALQSSAYIASARSAYPAKA